MDLPSTHVSNPPAASGVTLSFENLTFSAGDREILRPMSATIRPGSVVAILGPSGAGKTSLLNILAGRVTAERGRTIGGTVRVNGQVINPRAFRSKVAYVMQEDAFLPFTTPREALRFSANLRRPRAETPAEKEAVVQRMLKKMRLESAADTYVGDDMTKGISGGERKRTAIGVELVTDPSILFLDEPTSGLDSYGAESVVDQLRDVAAEGKLVLCTIHQPSSEVFHRFTHVILLAQGGLVYSGTVKDLVDTWGRAGFKMPNNHNPADYVMYQMQTRPQEDLARVRAENQATSAAAAGDEGVRSKGDATIVDMPDGGRAVPVRVEHRPEAPWPVQLLSLLRRGFLNTARNKPGLIARYSIPAFLNVLFGIIFLGAGDSGDIQTHLGAVTFVFISAMFGSAQPMILEFPRERAIFLRENATATYSGSAYFISKIALELPLAFANAVLVVLITYWLMALKGNPAIYILNIWGLGLVASATALVLGSVAANAEAATQASPVVFVPQLLFAGFFIKIAQIPVWLRWAQYLCALKYALNLAMVNEFADCAAEGDPQCAGLLRLNDVDPELTGFYAGIIVALFVGFQVVAYIFLTAKARASVY